MQSCGGVQMQQASGQRPEVRIDLEALYHILLLRRAIVAQLNNRFGRRRSNSYSSFPRRPLFHLRKLLFVCSAIVNPQGNAECLEQASERRGEDSAPGSKEFGTNAQGKQGD